MIRAGRWTPAMLVLAFVVLPIVEIWLLVEIGQRIGLLPVLALVIAEALVGGWLLRRRWRTAWRSLQDALPHPVPTPGRSSARPAGPNRAVSDAVDTAIVVAGGIALIFPGLITDLVAVICLVPFTRRLPRHLVDRWLDRRLARLGQGLRFPGRRSAAPLGEVIEGEVVEDPAAGRARPGRDDPGVIRGEIDDR